eukprot:scaffold223175_cov15-Tisochrysis_lutea.AAC.1
MGALQKLRSSSAYPLHALSSCPITVFENVVVSMHVCLYYRQQLNALVHICEAMLPSLCFLLFSMEPFLDWQEHLLSYSPTDLHCPDAEEPMLEFDPDK